MAKRLAVVLRGRLNSLSKGIAQNLRNKTMTSFHCDPMLRMRRFPGAVLFLASDDSSYISAVEPMVDGGLMSAPIGAPFFTADAGVCPKRAKSCRKERLKPSSRRCNETECRVHLVNHLATMADLHRAGSYDRMSNDVFTLTGRGPLMGQEFVRKHAVRFRAIARKA